MKIAIHDADAEHIKHKTFPNYALMKISAWHKAQGDTVEKNIRFSCDTFAQIEPIKKVARLLQERGVKISRLFIYLLVTKDIADAERRVYELRNLGGITIYAQAEQNPSKGIVPNAEQKEFANRYIYGGSFRSETWDEYCRRKNLNFDEEDI